MKKILWTMIFVMAYLLAGCELAGELGGTSAGNPPTSTSTRTMVGEVEEEDSSTSSSASPSALVRFLDNPFCKADSVLATAVDGSVIEESIETDCTFTITLITGTAYVISFEKSAGTVGTLLIQSGANSFLNAYVTLGEGDDPVDIGLVQFDKNVARPQKEPFEQSDTDGDGEDDFADADDNNDGVADLEDEDCDLDGLSDALDSDLEDCSDTDGDDAQDEGESGEDVGESTDSDEDSEDVPVQSAARILEVFPRHMAGIASPFPAVSLEETIQAHCNCDVDPASVDAMSFMVTDELGQEVECEYALDETDASVVICEPLLPLLPLGLYEVSVEGMTCLDGRTIGSRTWRWQTEADTSLF